MTISPNTLNPWNDPDFRGSVRTVLDAIDAALIAGDTEAYRTWRSRLPEVITRTDHDAIAAADIAAVAADI